MSEHRWASPRRVLVTGGTGFVGTYLCRALTEAGRQAVAVGVEPFDAQMAFVLGAHANDVPFVPCDVCDESAVAAAFDPGADAIVHVAGLVGHEASMRAPARTYAVNIGGTVNVLDAARARGIGKVVIVGTNAAYHAKQRPVFDETHPITSIAAGNPNAHYGTSKMAAEQIGVTYRTFHGMDVLVARITAVYGFGMRGPIYIKPLVEGAVKRELVAIATGGAVPRDYTYVGDAVAGIMAMLDADTRELEQRVFNIARGELASASRVAATVRAVVPGADVDIGEALTPLEAANVQQRAPLPTEAARRAFGFVPRFSLEDGVRAYVDVLTRFLGQP